MTEITVSVRDLVSFVHRGGDLDHRGIDLHRVHLRLREMVIEETYHAAPAQAHDEHAVGEGVVELRLLEALPVGARVGDRVVRTSVQAVTTIPAGVLATRGVDGKASPAEGHSCCLKAVSAITERNHR